MLEDSMKSRFSNERISYISIIAGLIAIIRFLGGLSIDAEATSYGSIKGKVVDRGTTKPQPIVRLALLIVIFPYQIGDKIVDSYRESNPNEEALLGALSWARSLGSYENWKMAWSSIC
jgi:hypothetical protein